MAHEITVDDQRLLALAREVLEIEALAVHSLAPRLGASFLAACRVCLGCRGRIIVTGMGKSGHVGRKIAATLASTGSPAFFLHPGEASHGDAGMITRDDVVIAVSNSGETSEIAAILPVIKRLGVPLVAMTGSPASMLAKTAEIVLDVSVEMEACPLRLAPTASTTATLAMGDALALALLEARGFTAEDFARSHPAGALGRRLLLHVSDVMHSGAEIPKVRDDALLGDALVEMTRKGFGMTAVVAAGDRLLGVFTDGDLRRALDQRVDHDAVVAKLMTVRPKTARPQMLAAEAVRLLEQYKITALPVVDDDGRLVGVLNVHDLLRRSDVAMPDVTARGAAIRLLVLDVDGVLTDGSIQLGASGEELKSFHVRDGLGIKRLLAAGIEIAVISGRHCTAVTRRMAELGVRHVFQGVDDKLPVFERLRSTLALAAAEVAVVGDDLPDLPAMRAAGLAIAVADAQPEVKAAAHWVTSVGGGRGAAREVADRLLAARARGPAP